MGPDVHTLTGPYALDALDEHERRQFEAHLAECPDCAHEVDELRVAAARLGIAAAQEPPDQLRARVLAQMAHTRQDPPLPAHPDPQVHRLESRQPTQRWTTRFLAAATGLATAAAVLFGMLTVRADQQRDTALAQLAGLRAQYQSVAQLAGAPDARIATGTAAGGGTVTVLTSRTQNRAVLLVFDLPAPPPAHTYQAWLIGTGNPRSVGLLAPAAGSDAAPGAAPLVFDGVGYAGKIGLTIEPAGGSPQPTTTPVALFSLPT
jgi:anti-sigma-K factor RskA